MIVTEDIELSTDKIEQYREEGYLRIPGFVKPEALQSLREEVLELMAWEGLDYERLRSSNSVSDKLRQCHTYRSGSYLDSLINGPVTLDIASQLLEGPAIRYLPFTAVKTGGGGGQFHFHQDNSYTRHEPAMGSINIWVALVEMSVDNGCLQMVPRSHQLGQLESVNAGDGDAHRAVTVDEGQAIPIEMDAGDAVAFTRWTVHGSGPNTTAEPRLAYALQYHRQDVQYLEDGEWRLLADQPRFSTEPVESLAAMAGDPS